MESSFGGRSLGTPRTRWRSPDNDDVREFHRKFDVPMNEKPGPITDESTQAFRINFMKEELEEYEIAIDAGDMEKAFDSLIDLVYVAHGAALIHGFPWAEGWHRVQAANMKKIAVRDTTGEGRHKTDVVKPEGWKPPYLGDLVDPNDDHSHAGQHHYSGPEHLREGNML